MNEETKKENETIDEILKQRRILLDAMKSLLSIYKNCEAGSKAEKLAMDGLESATWKRIK